MMFREIEPYDIHNNPTKVNITMTDNVHVLHNQLYILVDGNHVPLDKDTMNALQSLENYLKKVLDKCGNPCYNKGVKRNTKGIDKNDECR